MKIAVLGTGNAGLRHLRMISSLEGVDPIAVPIRSTRLAELETSGLTTAPDIPSAAANGACAVVIATDTGRHAEDALGAFTAGLDVLVEKPLAVDAGQALPVLKRAATKGRKAYVGCVLRFSESLNTFKERLGDVGPLHSVRIECQSYLPDWQPSRPYLQSFRARPNQGGVLLDLTHEIDYAGWIFQWPVSVQARVRNLGRLGISADEVADLTWETPAGCSVSVHLDFLSRPPRRGIRAYGEHGSIEWDGVAGKVTLLADGKLDKELCSTQTSDDMFLAQIKAFVGSVRGDGGQQPASLEDGVNALAVCDAARRASDSKLEELVEYPWPVVTPS